MNVSGGIPAPEKPKSLGDRIGALAAFIVLLVVIAVIAGFVSDLIIWGWNLGRSIIH